MNAYIYQADIYCEECGALIRQELDEQGACPADPTDESTFDSDEYPKGPYADGGGEADCPQHCAACGVFLENPLTSDGIEYVKSAISERQDQISSAEWVQFYGL